MVKQHHLDPKLVHLHGEEDVTLAEKTWPFVLPPNMRLAVILYNKFFWGDSSLEIALDVTEQERYTMYITQYLNNKWSSIKFYYLPVDKLDLCRIRYQTP